MSFAGFPRSGLDLLDELGTHDKVWFDQHRKQYDAEVATPAKAFVVAIGDLLNERISSGIEAHPKTNGSIAPINNDLRFSPDAAPYKDHLLFRFWEGPTKKTAPTLMVRVSSSTVGFATGLTLPDLTAWRSLIDDDDVGTAGAAAIESLATATRAELVGLEYKKVPKPFTDDHPRANLLRHKGLQIRWIRKTPRQVTSRSFASWCADELDHAADVHHWLVANFS